MGGGGEVDSYLIFWVYWGGGGGSGFSWVMKDETTI